MEKFLVERQIFSKRKGKIKKCKIYQVYYIACLSPTEAFLSTWKRRGLKRERNHECNRINKSSLRLINYLRNLMFIFIVRKKSSKSVFCKIKSDNILKRQETKNYSLKVIFLRIIQNLDKKVYRFFTNRDYVKKIIKKCRDNKINKNRNIL